MSQERDISLDVEPAEREDFATGNRRKCGAFRTLDVTPPIGLNPPAPVEASAVVPVVDVDRFYADVLHELQLLASAGGTATGAAAVVKRVALAHGVPLAAVLPLPRLNRAELEQLGRHGVSRARARRGVA